MFPLTGKVCYAFKGVLPEMAELLETSLFGLVTAGSDSHWPSESQSKLHPTHPPPK